MKLVLNGTQEFEVNKKPQLSGDPISFSLGVDDPADIPSSIEGAVMLKDMITWPKTGPVEEGTDPSEGEEAQEFVLFETTAENWLRHYVSGNVLYFTNMPVPEPVPEPTPEEIKERLAAQVRAQRDAALTYTDWTQLLDAPVDAASKEEVRVYRQALRDIPAQEGFPETVVWPEMPDVVKGNPDPVDAAVQALVGGEQ